MTERQGQFCRGVYRVADSAILRAMNHHPGTWFGATLLVISCFQVGCNPPQQGRDWKLYDQRSEWRSTSLGFSLEEGVTADGKNKSGFWNGASGCLEWRTDVFVTDTVDKWAVYECIDWNVTPVLGRSSKRFLITDPPGKEYMGATQDARPEDITGIKKEEVGSIKQALSLTEYPLLVEWQVSSTDGRTWLATSDEKLVLSGSWAVTTDGGSEHNLNLCDVELKKLLAYPAAEFKVTFRISPANWMDRSKSETKPVRKTSRERLTRKMIEDALAAQAVGPAVGGVVDPPVKKK